VKLRDALIAWNIRGGIKIGSRQEDRQTHWSAGYRMTGGSCNLDVHEARGDKAKLFALAEWQVVTFRDGVNSKDAHREFLKIDEYRAVAADI